MKRRLPRFCAGWKTTFRTINWSRPDIGWCMAGHFIPRRFVIDASVTAELRRLIPLAPLHQPHNLAAIAALSKLHPALPQIACFDTAFHHTQPEVATAFALPRRLTAEGIRRYGFHGLSYEYIASVLPDILGPAAADGRVVVAHLGSGASLCAIHRAQERSNDHGLYGARWPAHEPPVRQPRSGCRSLPDAGEGNDRGRGEQSSL